MVLPFLVCCGIVLAFDAVASVLSRAYAIPYGWFTIPQLVMYGVMGFLLYTLLGTHFYIAVIGAAICEATIGWWISSVIGPGRALNGTAALILFSTLFSICLNTCVGWVGSLAARLAFRS